MHQPRWCEEDKKRSFDTAGCWQLTTQFTLFMSFDNNGYGLSHRNGAFMTKFHNKFSYQRVTSQQKLETFLRTTSAVLNFYFLFEFQTLYVIHNLSSKGKVGRTDVIFTGIGGCDDHTNWDVWNRHAKRTHIGRRAVSRVKLRHSIGARRWRCFTVRVGNYVKSK